MLDARTPWKSKVYLDRCLTDGSERLVPPRCVMMMRCVLVGMLAQITVLLAFQDLGPRRSDLGFCASVTPCNDPPLDH